MKDKAWAYILAVLFSSIMLMMFWGGFVMTIVFAVKGQWLWAMVSLFVCIVGYLITRVFRSINTKKEED